MKTKANNVVAISKEKTTASLVKLLQQSRSLIGRVEASHRTGDISQSKPGFIKVKDGKERTDEEKMAYKVRDNLEFVAKAAGLSSDEVAEAVDALISAKAAKSAPKGDAKPEAGAGQQKTA